jgi:uncharacterized protein
MTKVFADSFYFFALLNPKDPAHAQAVAFTKEYTGLTITTGWILTELGDGWAKPTSWRSVFVRLQEELRNNSSVTVIPFTDHLMQEGTGLYKQRFDKEWSLTDCISFIVMQREGIRDALTGDRHFEQAGFVALLK